MQIEVQRLVQLKFGNMLERGIDHLWLRLHLETIPVLNLVNKTRLTTAVPLSFIPEDIQSIHFARFYNNGYNILQSMLQKMHLRK